MLGAFAGLAMLLFIGALLAGLIAIYFMPSLPNIDAKEDFQLKIPLRIYSSDGELIGEFAEEKRIPLTIEQTPKTLIDAVLAAEDDEFYEHHGIDFGGLIRAALANFSSGDKGQGASTITMQVARNFFLSPEKTYTRKIREILLSLKLEQKLSKDQILELYINKIFLGHRAYGFGAAAMVYYGENIQNLTLPEYAMLAGLPKAPSRDNPLSNPERAIKRRNYVLSRMLALKMITPEQYAATTSAPVKAAFQTKKIEHAAPYVAELVRQQMVEKYGEHAYTSGYKVFTTVSTKLQEAAQRALQKGLIDFSRRHGYHGTVEKLSEQQLADKSALIDSLKKIPSYGPLAPVAVISRNGNTATGASESGKNFEFSLSGWNNIGSIGRGDIVYVENITGSNWRLAEIPKVSGALASLHPDDGAILALVGGFSYYQSKYNRAVQAERQPGSNIKPFIYSAALDDGFTTATPISGAPIVVHDAGTGGTWRPENYSKKFFGMVPMRQALAKSMNLVSIRILRSVGVNRAIQHLKAFGFDEKRLPHNLSLALGTAALTPLEVASGFSVFANGGISVKPWFIARIEDADGTIIERHEALPVCLYSPETAEIPEDNSTANCRKRAISADNAFLTTSMMQSVIDYGTGTRAKALGRHDIAGKTGTTNEQKDAWFSGFNRDVETTVWVGYDQPKPMGRQEFGGRAALPIWIDYMKVALGGKPEKPFTPPPGIITRSVNNKVEYFMAGTGINSDSGAGITPDAGGQAAPTIAPKVEEQLF